MASLAELVEWEALIVLLGLTVIVVIQLLTGQIKTTDGSYIPCSGSVHPNPKRAFLWEIHPVYSLEVYPASVLYWGTAVTVTPFSSNFRRTSGDDIAESGAANLPFDKLSHRL